MNKKIAIIGLGYVGLPLAVEFGKTPLAPIVGFDISEKRVEELKRHYDASGEIKSEELAESNIEYTTDQSKLKDADFVIIAVPTPINEAKKPDLTPVIRASESAGQNLKNGSIVVYESTVYPGVTEDICVPIIEQKSGLICGKNWKVGYSPERVNPGDNEHTIDKIVKVVSGMDEETLEEVARIYGMVCKGGVHKAPTIKTAEAAKVIENIQRDLNIALMNELSLIFHKMGINTKDVLEAAGTKWNFHKYQPGLVGGHCIGVDPYYMTYRAEELGYNPQVILSGRRVNDGMADYVAELAIKGLIEAEKIVQKSTILIMGLTFKENVRDIRNSKVKDIIKKLKEYNINILGHDPLLSTEEIESFGVKNTPTLDHIKADGIILAVPHKEFLSLKLNDFQRITTIPAVFIDIKSLFPLARNDKQIIYKNL